MTSEASLWNGRKGKRSADLLIASVLVALLFSFDMIADYTVWKGTPKSFDTPLSDSPFPILKKNCSQKSLFSRNVGFNLLFLCPYGRPSYLMVKVYRDAI